MRNTLLARTGLLVVSVIALLFAGCDDGLLSDEVEQWRFAIEETRGSVQDGYAQRFKELIEERTNGEVEVKVYPYGTLGTSDHVTELVRMGTVQFAMASPGHLGTMIPEVQVLLLHFTLTDDEEVNKTALSDPQFQAALAPLYEDKGFRLLSVYPEGWMVWTANRMLRRPADFTGLKIRTMTSPMLLAAYRAYGAAPTPLSYGEVYSALQLNMIDAQVNPVFAIQEMSFYEVSDYMIFGNQAPFITTSLTNHAFFEEQSPDRQTLILEVIDELDEYIHELQKDYNQSRMDIIRDNKPDLIIVDDLTEEERDAFRQASLITRDVFVRAVGPSGEVILEELLASVERAKETHGWDEE